MAFVRTGNEGGRLWACCALALLSACAPDATVRKNQESGTIAIDPSGKLWVALEDNGGVAVVDPAAKSGRQAFIPTGSRPARLIIRGGSVYVSNRQSRTVSQIELSSQKVTRTFQTGAEPIGLDTSEDGATLIVSNAMSGTLQAFETGSDHEKWTTAINDEVHALTVLPKGRIYAPSFARGTMHVLDLASGKELSTIDLSEPESARIGLRQMSAVEAVAMGEEAGRIYLPYASLTSAPLDGTTNGFYAHSSSATGLAPAALSFATVQFDKDTVLHATDSDQKFLPPFIAAVSNTPLVGPRAIAVAPAGAQVFVVNQFSNNVAIFSTTREGPNTSQGLISTVAVGAGPTGIALARDDSAAYVYNALDHSISVLRSKNDAIVVAATIGNIAEQTLSKEQQNGRALFYSAADSRLSAQASGGIACATCHPDGRQDGHTWTFPEGVRNTPALVGRHLEKMAPYDSDGQMTTHQDFARVITDRMGGTGISASDLDDIFAWLEAEPAPDNPNHVENALTADQHAGRILFLTKAGCAACHSGADFTDNMPSEVGTSFTSIALDGSGAARAWPPKTPSLLGVFASPPYLHNGKALTLEDVVRKNGAGLHGTTSGLSDDEVKQLLAFLQAL
jgi:DNA-binding beta-propeller fold protein YncE